MSLLSQPDGNGHRKLLFALFIGIEVFILARFSWTGLQHVQQTANPKAVASSSTPAETLANAPDRTPDAADSNPTVSNTPPDSTASGLAGTESLSEPSVERQTAKQPATERSRNGRTNNRTNKTKQPLSKELEQVNAEQYQQGLQQGYTAAVAVQQASTKDQWNQAVELWGQSITTLSTIDPSSTHHEPARGKITEYTQNQAYARQAAAQSQPALTQLQWNLGLVDPTQTLIRDIQAGNAQGWIEATVSEGWHLHSREMRLTTAQRLRQQWASLYSLDPTQADAKIRLITERGLTVGISRRQGTAIEIRE